MAPVVTHLVTHGDPEPYGARSIPTCRFRQGQLVRRAVVCAFDVCRCRPPSATDPNRKVSVGCRGEGRRRAEVTASRQRS